MEEILHPIPLLLAAAFCFLFSSFLWRRRAKSRCRPPGPPAFPVIGNLHSLRDNPHVSLDRLSKKYGPIMHLRLGSVPTVVVSAADVAAEILRNQDHVFCSRSRMVALHRLSYGGSDIGFSPYGDSWKQVRRVCNTEIFGPGRVQSFAALRSEEVSTLLSTVSKAAASGVALNLTDALLCCVNNILFRQIFGERISGDGECGASPHQNLLRRIVTLMTRFAAEDFFPRFGWIFDRLSGYHSNLEKVFGEMDSLFDEKIRRRLLAEDPGRQEDFLGVLLDHLAKQGDASLTINQVKAVLMNMFTAGIDTSAATIEWGMSLLIGNPTKLQKAVDEVRAAIGSKGEVEESDLQHLHYLKSVIKETLRLHPPGPMLPPRESMKSTKINGYDIPAKTRVYVNVWSIGRDPKTWVDPDLFCPERFMDSPINFKGSYFEYIPFGSGRRMCPGMGLGMANVELIFANILYWFDWKLPRGMIKDDVDMRPAPGMVTPKKVPLTLMAKAVFAK